MIFAVLLLLIVYFLYKHGQLNMRIDKMRMKFKEITISGTTEFQKLQNAQSASTPNENNRAMLQLQRQVEELETVLPPHSFSVIDNIRHQNYMLQIKLNIIFLARTLKNPDVMNYIINFDPDRKYVFVESAFEDVLIRNFYPSSNPFMMRKAKLMSGATSLTEHTSIKFNKHIYIFGKANETTNCFSTISDFIDAAEKAGNVQVLSLESRSTAQQLLQKEYCESGHSIGLFLNLCCYVWNNGDKEGFETRVRDARIDLTGFRITDELRRMSIRDTASTISIALAKAPLVSYWCRYVLDKEYLQFGHNFMHLLMVQTSDQIYAYIQNNLPFADVDMLMLLKMFASANTMTNIIYVCNEYDAQMLRQYISESFFKCRMINSIGADSSNPTCIDISSFEPFFEKKQNE